MGPTTTLRLAAYGIAYIPEGELLTPHNIDEQHAFAYREILWGALASNAIAVALKVRSSTFVHNPTTMYTR